VKIWIIKHRGADWWGNYRHSREIEITDNGETRTIYADLCFYRKKDAELYLKAKMGEATEFYEVTGKI
jgi:hypothetical protein